MPQNTPMKRQFTTIDGRTVMSNLPQHWGGNDWKITGVDNPLPVGNYVQTESGVWIPQKGSDDGAADVRLTGSIVVQRLANNVTIAPSATWSGTMVDISDVKEHAFYVSITQNAKLTAYFEVIDAGGGGRSSSMEIADIKSVPSNRPWYVENKVTPLVTGILPRVTNNGDVDARLDLWIVTRR